MAYTEADSLGEEQLMKLGKEEDEEGEPAIERKWECTDLRLDLGEREEQVVCQMKGSARGNWDPREGQQPFRLNPNGAGDRTTRLRRLLIGAEVLAL